MTRKAAETLVGRHVSEPPPTDEQPRQEQADGFLFLLEGAEAAKWTPNDPRFTAGRPALIENGSLLDVHGDARPGVIFYNDIAPFGDVELHPR